jgi:hypothetical protein
MPRLTDEASQRRLAERRLLQALQRFHRHEPMVPDMRADALIAALRDATGRPVSHRGATPLTLSEAELRGVLDELVARGEVHREGRRVRLPGHGARLEGEARRLADALLGELAAAGHSPPRAEPIARRLGAPDWVLDALRRSGERVAVAPGIEYPRDLLDALLARLGGRDLSVAELRDELGTSRRYAAALRTAMTSRR